MALKHLIILLPLIFASSALGKFKKACPDPKGDGGGDKIFVPIDGSNDCPPKGDCPPKDDDCFPKGDCPPKDGDCSPKGDYPPKDGDCPPKDGDNKDYPPKDGGGDKKDCPHPKGDGGVAPGRKDCPDPKGDGDGGGDKKDRPDPKGDHCIAPGGKDCPDPKGDGGSAPKDGGGNKNDCRDPKGDGCVAPGGKDCPDPKGDDGATPKYGDGDKKDCPYPKGDGGVAPKGGGGGDMKECPNPKGDDKKDSGGGGKDCPNPNDGGGGGGKDCLNKPGDENKDEKKDGGPPPCFDPPLYKKPILDSDYKGEWFIHNNNCGVIAMQHQLMPNNKAVWFDTTNLGPSAIELGPKGNCPLNPDNNNEPDCFAHAIQYDIETGNVKSVYIETDPWGSSGHMLPTGDLLSTGGNKLGEKSVRLFKKDDPVPKFVERKKALGAGHWYASNCVLEDGSAAIIGGRESFSYDLVPPSADFKPNNKNLPFLEKTTVPKLGPKLHVENNLYPFTYLLPDGNIFIFANDRAISFNPQSGETVKEYPVLEGGSRNYPPSGQSALFPIRLSADNKPVKAEIVVCGGNNPDAFPNVDPRYTNKRVFAPALSDCNRIVATDANPVWKKEQDMPSPRVMGDLLQLPNGQFLLINGAKKGTSGWDDGEDPNLTPTLYMPENEMGDRFRELKPTNIPRMYHSSTSVLPDGKILVAGSNAHKYYTYDGPYPTELRVEKFSPHYLDPKFEKDRPVIAASTTDKQLKYGKEFKVTFTIATNHKFVDGDVIITILYPPFTTHGFSQNQRMVICPISKLGRTTIAIAPPSGKVAVPGYYILYVNHRNIPSKGVWVQLGA